MLISSLGDFLSAVHHLPDLLNILGGIQSPIPPVPGRSRDQSLSLPAKERGPRDIEHLADLVGLVEFLLLRIVNFLHAHPQTSLFISVFAHTTVSIVDIVHLSRKPPFHRGWNEEKRRGKRYDF
jgi:hypothetical protein